MHIKETIKETEGLIDLISRQAGKTISDKNIKIEVEEWVTNYYGDLLNNFNKDPLRQEALNYLNKAYTNDRLKKRLWLKNLKMILKALKRQKLVWRKKSRDLPTDEGFTNKDRLVELKKIKNNNYDLSRLIKMCEELNDALSRENYISTIALTRIIIDHVPPIFGCKNFPEVANNYKGAKSFKKSMLHLDQSSRNIADSYLHIQIRKKETLPTDTQVNFSNDLDVLLGEIIRILK